MSSVIVRVRRQALTMQNRFGLKDFVFLVILVAVAVMILLGMQQRDRQWNRMDEIGRKIDQIERNLSQVQARLDSGVAMIGGAGTGIGSGSTPGVRDESWARPGVEIKWQPAPAFTTDPRSQPDFQVGGEFTEIYEAQMARLTPYISSDVYARRIHEFVLGSLGSYDPKTLKMRGDLAEAWQVDPNGLWLRARIRANARFSDGQPVTAEDIRWTFHDYIMNEQIEAERSRSILRDSIKEVRVIDERTVEFDFHEVLFSNIDNALGLFVLPKHIYSEFEPGEINQGTGLMVGSGPFRLRNFDPDRQWRPPADVVLERNEQYWGAKPPLDGLRFKSINEEVARMNAFKKGEGDMITPAAAQFISMRDDPAWKDRAQYLQWVNMRSGYSFIAWNAGERNGKLTPFHDRRVRLAMTHAIDRKRMIQDIWRGVGEVAKGNQPLNSPGSNPDLKPWPYNPQRAKELLKEAGWEDRDGNGVLEDRNGNEFEFEFSYASGGEIAEKIARFVADSCTAVGIRVRLRGADWSVYQDYMKTRDFDAITLGWGASAPESDPRQIFHSDSIKNQGDNFAQWSNAEADRLIDAGRREIDDEKRFAIWRQLEAVLHEDQPYTFVRVPPWTRIVSISAGNVQTYPKGLEHPEFFRRSGPAAPTPAN
ncbi:MAG: hypothetical protein KF768_06190 [Phycisphaeraceae bacterium]|nr:hypothetical protein [Phycisphaeraceae bacterium]